MLNCYLLTVCQASTIDANTQTLSLFNIIESVTIAPFRPGAPVGLEVHALFEVPEGDRGQEFETQLVWISPDGQRSTSGAAPRILLASANRLRVRALQLIQPPAPGHYHIKMEVRRRGASAWETISPTVPVSLLTTDAISLPTEKPVHEVRMPDGALRFYFESPVDAFNRILADPTMESFYLLTAEAERFQHPGYEMLQKESERPPKFGGQWYALFTRRQGNR